MLPRCRSKLTVEGVESNVEAVMAAVNMAVEAVHAMLMN